MTQFAKLLSEPGNFAIVQLPGRKYPGVVVQGDTLAEIVKTLGNSTKSEDIDEIYEQLHEVLEWYKTICEANSIKLNPE